MAEGKKNTSGYTEKQKKMYEKLYSLAEKKAAKRSQKGIKKIDQQVAKGAYKGIVGPEFGKNELKMNRLDNVEKIYDRKTAKLVRKKNWSDADVGSVKSDVAAAGKKAKMARDAIRKKMK